MGDHLKSPAEAGQVIPGGRPAEEGQGPQAVAGWGAAFEQFQCFLEEQRPPARAVRAELVRSKHSSFQC